MFRLTPVVKNLLIINIVIFILQAISPQVDVGYCIGYPNLLSDDLLTSFIALFNVRTDCFKPFQLFTYMFAHDGFGHIFGNMLFLLAFGPTLEEYWGQRKFLFFYMAAGLGAAIFYVLMTIFLGTDSYPYMLGASGAVYGVMTAFGIIFADMEMRLLFFPISFKAKYVVLVLGSITIISSFRPRAAGDDVAHLAHLGGIVIAIVLLLFWRSQGRY